MARSSVVRPWACFLLLCLGPGWGPAGTGAGGRVPAPGTGLERECGRVAALLTCDQPKALNLLVMIEAVASTTALDRDPECGCIVITGSAEAFAAGAAIEEMQSQSYLDIYPADFTAWDRLGPLRTPTLAARWRGTPSVVAASRRCGSRRLTRAVGKAKAMEMRLTGRAVDATEAERVSLVSRVLRADELLDEALAVAETVAGMSLTVMAKEAVAQAFETSLSDDVRFQRRLFHAALGVVDQEAGMGAIVEKRLAEFWYR
ncbi:enoyl-CoA hydratase-related protein [Streptomyces sp. NPDC094038]|uniref:enoyl-CoA hydratase-related protein n=1 Tax=Streptomyces sp. NPDC094038 TaxID=3366055 RepID=UPI0038025E70